MSAPSSDHHLPRHPRCSITVDWREEIEERTRNGESCKQIADALQAKGVNTSDKTISRKRVEWGLRRRAVNTTKGTPRPRARTVHPEGQFVGLARNAKNHRKEEIIQLTNEGKTPEEIAAILTEKGAVFKSGASTIWRLQTFWKLIPFDPERAYGRGKYKKPRPSKPRGPKLPKPKTIKWVGQENTGTNATNTMHYPGDCSFGPQKRGTADGEDDAEAAGSAAPYPPFSHNGDASTADTPIQIDSSESGSDIDMDAESLAPPDDYASPAHIDTMMPPPQPQTPPLPQPPRRQALAMKSNAQIPAASQTAAGPEAVSSMSLMSAEMLVDLATSTLAAANNLRHLVLASHLQRPAPDSIGVLPPSAEDIAAARRKFVEWAKVAIDLAGDPPS